MIAPGVTLCFIYYYVTFFRILPDNSGIFVFWTFFLSFLLIYTWKGCCCFVIFCKTVDRCEELTNEIVTEFIFRNNPEKPTHFKMMRRIRSIIQSASIWNFDQTIFSGNRYRIVDCPKWSMKLNMQWQIWVIWTYSLSWMLIDCLNEKSTSRSN